MSGLERVLENLLVPDTAVIQEASKQLIELYKDPKIIVELCSLMQNSPNSQVRQHASILIRKKLQKFWSKLPQDEKNLLKVTLIQALINEQIHFVRRSIAQLIGEIGKTDIPANQWPEILQLLQEWCMSQEPKQRELGMSILSIVISEAGCEMEAHHANLITLCHNLLSDPTLEVRINVFKCLIYLIPFLKEQHAPTLKAMFPSLIQSVEQLITEEAETEAQEAMEVFEEILDCEMNIISSHLPNFLRFTLQMSSNEKLKDITRTRALSLISWLISTKKKVLLKLNLLPDILSVLFPLIATPLTKEEEEITGEETQHPSSVAAQVLDSLSLFLPPEKIFTPSLAILEPLLASGNAWQRKAGLTAMGVMSEGCSEYVRNNYLAPALTCVCQGLADQELVVQKAALFALGQFSLNLQPDVSKYSGQVLPILLEYLKLTKAREKDEKSWIMRTFVALEYTVENLGCSDEMDSSLGEYCEQQVDTFLPTLMETLLALLSSAETDSLKELVISCIGATANAAKQKILPYFQKIMEFFRAVLSIPPTEDNTLIHAQTIDTLAVLARTVGKEHFIQLSEECLELGLRLLKDINDPDLRRSIFGLFAAVSVVIGESIAPKLQEIVTHMITSLSSADAFASLSNIGEDEGPFTFEDFDEFEVIDDLNGEDENGSDGELNLGMLNSYLEELEDTCNALGEIAEHTGKEFLPYFEMSFNEMTKMSEHPGEGVRKASVTTLAKLAHSLNDVMNEYQVGDCEKALKKIADSCIPLMTSMIRTDSVHTVVLAAIQALEEMLKFVSKPSVSDSHKIHLITQCIQDVLEKKAICQESDEDDEEFDFEDLELAEVDATVIESAANLIPALGKALGPEAFVEHFRQFSPYIFAKFTPTATVSDRSGMVGVLAECVESLDKYSAQFPNMLTVFLEYTKDSEDEVRSNSVFGLGMYACHAVPDVIAHYPTILQNVSALLTPEQDPRVVDNAMAAVARMIFTSPESVPLDQILPVLISNLPLKKDFPENKTIYECISKLVQVSAPAILANLPALLAVFAVDLSANSKLTTEDRALIIFSVQHLNQNFGNEVQQAAAGLSPEQLGILQQAAATV
ncbi:Importin-4-like [Oopsacas minuta]|uniref:Importin-4-like n=1 Tax=Oopsacas minuta TaxID=111878 RepID=A0AAV7JXN9_9METZ|nr:Importin-4-like [Oopsacas minuta]